MKCLKCNFENPQTAKFCMECGTELENVCPKCGTKLPETAKFCMACGAKLGTVEETENVTSVRISGTFLREGGELPKLEDLNKQVNDLVPNEFLQNNLANALQATGENRLVTALFADISGFTKLSATQSSETIFQLIQNCFKQLVDIVANYDGIISGFRGDGLLALFGAPIMHENDAERALLAAIEMRNVIRKQQLEISVGINTAPMTVGEVQTQLHREYTAYGTDIILAKRFEEAAKPGQFLVGIGTHRVTRRAFDFEVVPELHLNGFSQPVTAYELQRVKPEPEKLRGIEGLQAQMIGRDKEFSMLRSATDRWLRPEASQVGGQIVSIIGEAGIGKSRLVTELKSYLEEQQKGNWLEGRCVSIGQPISYRPFLDILRTYFSLNESDDTDVMIRKVTDALTNLFPENAEELLPFLGNLLSIQFGSDLDDRLEYATPDQIKYQTLMHLRDFFMVLAQQQPLLLILEDLHWADDLSLDLISLLIDELASIPMMLLCVYRPEKQHSVVKLSDQAQQKCLERYTEIRLQQLSKQKSRELVETLLKIENLPENVKEMILRKSEGNPFFIEEVIRSLVERDLVYCDSEGHWKARSEITDIDVPDMVQSIVMTRVDRLQSGAKYVLQCASVIGRLFKYRLLEHLVEYEQGLDRYLSELEERELVYEERTMPELEYTFRHVLTQEATYNSMLDIHRKEFHLRVAQGIERLYQGRIEEYYEELADHYSRSEDTSKAVEYLLKAGEKAKSMYANQEAILYFGRALDFLRLHPNDGKRMSSEVKTYELLGDVLSTTGAYQESEIQFQYALNLATKQQDVRQIASLLCKQANAMQWQREFDRAIEIAEPGLEKLGVPPMPMYYKEAANLLEVIGRSYLSKGDVESAQGYANQIAQIIRQIPYYDSIYKPYYWVAYVEMRVRNFQAAMNWLEELESICLEHNNEVGLARCYHGRGDLYRRQNEFQIANQWYQKSLSYCERAREAYLLLEGNLELAYTLIFLDGDPSQIEEHIQWGMEIAEQMASSPQLASVPELCIMLGDAYLEKGNSEQAMFYFHRGIEFGPRDSALVSLLSKLESLYVQQVKQKEFFDFCQQTEQQEPFQSQTSLRYWHLKPDSPSEDYPQLTWCDFFAEPLLHEEWSWVDPQGESRYDFIQPGILELWTSAGHKLFSIEPKAPRLLRQISGDFAVETRIVDIEEGKHQVGGLLLWASPKMYLTFGKGLSHTNELRLEIYQQGRRETIGRGWLSGPQLHLRLERNGKLISALCSNNDKEWQIGGVTSFPMDDPIQVGFYVACPGNLPNSTVCFREFKLFQ